jgi:hypothetical protein
MERELSRLPILPAFGLAYLGLGVVLGLAATVGGVQSSLFPTGWLFPAILAVSGALMTVRRRFDIVAALWASLLLAVFLIDFTTYMNAVDVGVEQLATFDATIIAAVFALVPLVLRPQFRSPRGSPGARP